MQFVSEGEPAVQQFEFVVFDGPVSVVSIARTSESDSFGIDIPATMDFTFFYLEGERCGTGS